MKQKKKSMIRVLNPGKRLMVQTVHAYLEDILRLAQLLGYSWTNTKATCNIQPMVQEWKPTPNSSHILSIQFVYWCGLL